MTGEATETLPAMQTRICNRCGMEQTDKEIINLMMEN